jgi:hypothetical protein
LDEADNRSTLKARDQEKQKEAALAIARQLPRSRPQLWDSSTRDYPRFKKEVEWLADQYPSDSQGKDAMLSLISDQGMRDRLSIFSSVKAALDSLDLEFGNPRLAGPDIIREMESLVDRKLTENEVIKEIQLLFARLQLVRGEELVTQDVIFHVIHALGATTGKTFLDALSSITEPVAIRTKFFALLEARYITNTQWLRSRKGTATTVDKKPVVTTSMKNRRTGVDSDESQNNFSPDRAPGRPPRREWNHNCVLCAQNHPVWQCLCIETVSLQKLESCGLCLSCLRQHDQSQNCFANASKWYGRPAPFVCQECGRNKKITVAHKDCKLQKPSQNTVVKPGVPAVPQPQHAVKQNRSTSIAKPAKYDDLQVKFPGLLNPGQTGQSVEVVDHCVILGRDGQTKKVRVLHDAYACTDSIIDVSLRSYAHHVKSKDYTVQGSTGSETIHGEEFVITLLKPDGEVLPIKCLSGNLTGREAFIVRQKSVSVPGNWASAFGIDNHPENVDLHWKTVQGLRPEEVSGQVDLLLGSDLAWLSPLEINRHRDQHGSVVMYRSALHNDYFIFSGNRGTCSPAGETHAVSRRAVVSRRTMVQQQKIALPFPVDPVHHLNQRDRLFLKWCADSELLAPLLKSCQSCKNCIDCKEAQEYQYKADSKKAMDQIVSYTPGSWESGGGFRAVLPWHADKKAQVLLNEEASVHRFLAMERKLKSLHPDSIKHLNQKMEEGFQKGFFIYQDDFDKKYGPEVLKNLQQSYLPVGYALRDTPEAPDDNTTKTKCRLVIDASYAPKGRPSVNEALIDLPDLWAVKIPHLMLKFRTVKHLAMTDVKSMFYKIKLDFTTVAMTKLHWRHGGVHSEAPLVPVLCLVGSMGLTSMPSVASHVRASLSQMLESDQTAQQDIRDSYVDDLHVTSSYDENPIVLVQRVLAIEAQMRKVHLNGSGWVSDLKLNLNQIIEDRLDSDGNPKGKESLEAYMATTKLDQDSQFGRVLGGGPTKAEDSSGCLGVKWDVSPSMAPGGVMTFRATRPDSINFLKKQRGKRPPEGELRTRKEIETHLATRGITKSGLLGLVMSLFDTLQLATPWLVSAKLLYRQVLMTYPELNWEDKIPEHLHGRITDLATDLLTVVKQPWNRAVVEPREDGETGVITLATTGDGSPDCACALAYVVQEFQDGTTRAQLLAGASKLLQLRHNSQVEGEVVAATLAAKLQETVQKFSRIKFARTIILLDSLTVMRCLHKNSVCFSTWAAARLGYIQRTVNLEDVHHVPGSWLNLTADKGTRALDLPSQAMDSAYWTGEGSVNSPVSSWPVTDPNTYQRSLDLPRLLLSKFYLSEEHQMKSKELLSDHDHIKACVTITKVEAIQFRPLDVVMKNHRSLEKILRITEKVLRFGTPRAKRWEPHQLRHEALQLLIRQDFAIIGEQLKGRGITKGLLLQTDKKSKRFFVCGRRLSPDEKPFQVTLLSNPARSWLSRRILGSYHNQHHLQSVAYILAKIGRSWMFHGGASGYLKKLRNSCPMCRILDKRAMKALMGPVHPMTTLRNSDCAIMTKQQIDIAGPVSLWPSRGRSKRSRGNRPSKYWILTAVCLGSKYITATVIEDYSSAAILMGWDRLMSRFGRPSAISWDCAANLSHSYNSFLSDQDGDEEEIDIASRQRTANELVSTFTRSGITVYPSIPKSPWRQGSIEAMIKQIKICLKKALFSKKLSSGNLSILEFCTFLEQALGYLNNRPLVVSTGELSPAETNVLTPSFLTASNMLGCHSGSHGLPAIQETTLTARAVRVRERFEEFKRTLSVFQHNQLKKLGHMNASDGPLTKGDVVLILDRLGASGHPQLATVDSVESERHVILRYIVSPGTPMQRAATISRTVQGVSKLTDASFSNVEADPFSGSKEISVDVFGDQEDTELANVLTPTATNASNVSAIGELGEPSGTPGSVQELAGTLGETFETDVTEDASKAEEDVSSSVNEPIPQPAELPDELMTVQRRKPQTVRLVVPEDESSITDIHPKQSSTKKPQTVRLVV